MAFPRCGAFSFGRLISSSNLETFFAGIDLFEEEIVAERIHISLGKSQNRTPRTLFMETLLEYKRLFHITTDLTFQLGSVDTGPILISHLSIC
jgi:hypothetical protein